MLVLLFKILAAFGCSPSEQQSLKMPPPYPYPRSIDVYDVTGPPDGRDLDVDPLTLAPFNFLHLNQYKIPFGQPLREVFSETISHIATYDVPADSA